MKDPSIYLIVRYVHILTAILALGTSAGLGIVLEFFGADPAHGAYVLRAILRLLGWFVLPGYLLMLLTGAWLTELSWGLSFRWVQAAPVLWAAGGLCLLAALPVLRRQIALLASTGPVTPGYWRVTLAGRLLGAAAGLMVVLILYLMVFKPPLSFLP